MQNTINIFFKVKSTTEIDKLKQKLSSSPYLTFPFKQKDLIEKYDSLNPGGTCFGLCFDYTRYTENHGNPITHESSYITKLKRKIDNKSNNFLKRVDQYQKYLQFSDLKWINLDESSQINFIESLSDESKPNHVIGLGFKLKPSFDAAGHIIALQPLRGTSGNFGYKIFDPNFGEFDFSANQTIDNIRNCNEILSDLRNLYSYYGLTKCETIDLSQKVIDYNLIKPHDISVNYSGEQKYLDGAPKFPGKELYKTLNLALSNQDTNIIKAIIKNYGSDFIPLISQNILKNATEHNDKEIIRFMCLYVDKSVNQLFAMIQHDTSKLGEFLPLLVASFIRQEMNINKDLEDKTSITNRIEEVPEIVREELALQINIELSDSKDTLLIKQMIEVFPLPLREKYFYNLATKIFKNTPNQEERKTLLKIFPQDVQSKIIIDSLSSYNPKSSSDIKLTNLSDTTTASKSTAYFVRR